jgi:hypothetical protein
VLTLFGLVAFGLQTYIVQTHIHFGVTAAAIVDENGPAPAEKSGDPLRPNPHQLACPLCQQLAHSGPAVVPAPLFFVDEWTYTAFVLITRETTRRFHSPTHIWQGRAPPLA